MFNPLKNSPSIAERDIKLGPKREVKDRAG
jgi:hypothetical protein